MERSSSKHILPVINDQKQTIIYIFRTLEYQLMVISYKLILEKLMY